AEHEASAAEEIERRDLLGQQQRMALGHEHDAGTELHPPGHARGARECDERIDEVRIRLGDDTVLRAGEAARGMHRDERMLSAPEGFEAERFDLLRHEGDVHQIGGPPDGDPDVHLRASRSDAATCDTARLPESSSRPIATNPWSMPP